MIWHHHLTSNGLLFFSICDQANIAKTLNKVIKIILYASTQSLCILCNKYPRTPGRPHSIPSNHFWAPSVCCESRLQRGVTPALTSSNSCPVTESDLQSDPCGHCGKGHARVTGLHGLVEWGRSEEGRGKAGGRHRRDPTWCVPWTLSTWLLPEHNPKHGWSDQRSWLWSLTVLGLNPISAA